MNVVRETDLEKSILEQLSLRLQESHLVFCYQQVASVLDVAKELAKAGINKNSLILARSQSAGRGQQGRSWISVEGAFLACLLFPKTTVPKPSLPAFSLVVGLQVANILLEYGVKVGVKWPNDVLTQKERKKICGILLETDLFENMGASSLSLRVGIGVNLQGCPEEGSSVFKEINKSLPLEQFTAKVIESCLAAYEIFEQKGFAPFQSEWNDHDLLIDQELEFQHGGQVIRGRGVGVDTEGRIVMKVDGRVMSFSTGRVLR